MEVSLIRRLSNTVKYYCGTRTSVFNSEVYFNYSEFPLWRGPTVSLKSRLYISMQLALYTQWMCKGINVLPSMYANWSSTAMDLSTLHAVMPIWDHLHSNSPRVVRQQYEITSGASPLIIFMSVRNHIHIFLIIFTALSVQNYFHESFVCPNLQERILFDEVHFHEVHACAFKLFITV